MRMRRLYSGTIVFEVPYEGKWYAIDSLSVCPAMYEGSGIPQVVVDRAISAIDRAYGSLGQAPADSELRSIGESALKEEFGDARFVSDTYPYGVVIG
ncbi:hypothetical protein ACTM8Z_08470 [Atopobiaceae bacterium HCP3S3_D6]